MLTPVADILAHAEPRKSHLTRARPERYKAEVRRFGIASDRGYRDDPVRGPGLSPPRVGTDAERGFAEARGATAGPVERRGLARERPRPIDDRTPLTSRLGLRVLLLSQLTC